jgi:hypothetical protein
MIRKEKPNKPISQIEAELTMKPGQPGTPIGKLPKPIGRPIGKPIDRPKPKPERPITIMPVKPKPMPKPDFGKVLGQQPITMGEGYRDEINTIRPRGNGSAMNKQYRAQGGGRFK